MRSSQPLIDGSNEDGRLVADGEFLVASGHCPVPLEAVDPASDRMALAVVGLIELWRPTEPSFLRCQTWSALSGMVQRIPRWR